MKVSGKTVDHIAVKLRRKDIPLQKSNGVKSDAHDSCHLGLGQVVAPAEIADVLAKDLEF